MVLVLQLACGCRFVDTDPTRRVKCEPLCNLNNGGCEENATCTAVVGTNSVTCTCKEG